jgi:hypothetical protein
VIFSSDTLSAATIALESASIAFVTAASSGVWAWAGAIAASSRAKEMASSFGMGIPPEIVRGYFTARSRPSR